MNRSVNYAGPHNIAAPGLASPSFKADPYPFYSRLRAEAPCGARRCPASGRRGW